jgi:hypothetical protein
MLRRKLAKAAQLHRSDEPNSVLVDQLLDLVTQDHRSKRRHTTYDVEHRLANICVRFSEREDHSKSH